MEYLLGVDYGGSAVKATLLDKNGCTCTMALEEYTTYYPRESWAEHDPEELYRVFCKVSRRILSTPGLCPEDVVALAISAGSQSAVYLDAHDRVVRNAIYWADMRAIHYALEFKKNQLDYFFRTTANQPTASRTINHIMWIRDNEPEAYRQIRKIMFTKDYIRYRLTGDFVTDYIDAMGSHFMDVPNRNWSKTLCDYAGITTEMLPQICSPLDLVSPITPAAAAETGLSPRTKVYVGSTDTVMEVYANGAIHEGDMIVKVATAGRIISIAKAPIYDVGIVNYEHVVPGLWYPGTGRGYCASSYRWFRDVMGQMEMETAKAQGIDPYVLLDRLAMKAPAGSAGMMFMPYLGGSNVEPSRRASFVNVRADHTKAHFVRAVLEGVGYAMKEDFATINRMKLMANNPVLIGGGAKGKIWPQIIADMLGIEMGLTQNGDSSLGSAMLAGVASGIFSSFEDSVHKCVRKSGSILPNPTTAEIYEKGFAVHEKMIEAMDPVYKIMNG